MLFMCQGTAREGLSPQQRQQVLQLFAGWTPPPGLEIKAHYVSAEGGDFVVVETTSAEALLEATALWAPFVAYRVTPIIEAPAGVASLTRAETTRQTLL
jgi:hypothetical protein